MGDRDVPIRGTINGSCPFRSLEHSGRQKAAGTPGRMTTPKPDLVYGAYIRSIEIGLQQGYEGT